MGGPEGAVSGFTALRWDAGPPAGAAPVAVAFFLSWSAVVASARSFARLACSSARQMTPWRSLPTHRITTDRITIVMRADRITRDRITSDAGGTWWSDRGETSTRDAATASEYSRR